ncbi:DUF1014-domain-containing protein [Biscogniauxia marginata]|nr:DUF1014-domain-containing protein [Biscogniauxia marginata]
MAGKKGGDGSKKAAGQARKADAAAKKTALEDAKKAAVEDDQWQKGAKNNSKKEAEAARKAEQARKKAEKDALLAEEEKELPTRAVPKNKKTAVKKTNRGLDDNVLAEFDLNDKKLHEGTARNVLDAIELLGLDTNSDEKADKHPERRLAAAYAMFEERRLQEMKDDGSSKGLRLSQRKVQIKKEFEKSPENPMNSELRVKHNATADEIREAKCEMKARIEARLAAD